MGHYYHSGNGDLQLLAGRGRAEYGASTVRKGTWSFTETIPVTAGWKTTTITFTDAMPDTDYEIIITPTGQFGVLSQDTMTPYQINNKTVNGFTLIFWNNAAEAGLVDIQGTYTAFKLYTDTEYNGLLNNQRYSTSEIDTGKKWIDGKTIYRKVVDCGALPNATTKNVAHGITGLDTVVTLYGAAKDPTSTVHIPLPYSEPTASNTVGIYIQGSDIRIGDGYDYSNLTAKVVIEYTKS